MILVDSRKDEGAKLFPEIKRLGVPCEKYQLEFGDVAFEGQTPQGTVLVGFERKTLSDILACIDTGRLSGHQAIGMKAQYGQRFLVVEGNWKPKSDETLLEGYNNGTFWKPCSFRSRPVMYSKLRRFLFSVEMSGIHVMITRDLFHTAYDIVECYHWFQKAEHRSMMEKHQIIVPSLDTKPPLVRRWAEELTGIGSKSAEAAARYFKKPIKLAQADELEWIRAGISGVGVKTAQQIVQEIRGNK